MVDGMNGEIKEFARMSLAFQARHPTPAPGRFGKYLGRGDGKIDGKLLKGRVVWDLYEIQGPAACEANLVGSISTRDEAEIGFELLGFFKHRPDTHYWDLASALRFQTDDPRYACFDNCLAYISGFFDMATYTHEYRLFAPGCRV